MCIVLYMHKVVDVWAGYGEGEACPDGMQRSWQFHHDAILKFEEVRFFYMYIYIYIFLYEYVYIYMFIYI